MILVVGVNGTGKTTTIGKLAWHLRHALGQQRRDRRRRHLPRRRRRPARALGRARRTSTIVKGPSRAPTPAPSSSTPCARGRERGVDVVIVDTAGRLHTQHNLMEELAKIRRVITQADARARRTRRCSSSTPRPARTASARPSSSPRRSTSPASSSTKLDGTAKGGIALAIANELGIPVKLIGVGEQLEDLRPFDADDFAKALLTA